MFFTCSLRLYKHSEKEDLFDLCNGKIVYHKGYVITSLKNFYVRLCFFLSFNFNTSCLSEANNLCAMYECTFDISVHAHPAW